ncbi:MAG: antibiotic biosynthesis monooxygenase [Bdellovibrionota bacterium]
MISKTPNPPYYAAIFTSIRTDGDNGYGSMADKMVHLSQMQAGFLGMESVRDSNGFGITISYWETLESITNWKQNIEHREAQNLGKEKWYKQFKVRICKVERDY